MGRDVDSWDKMLDELSKCVNELSKCVNVGENAQIHDVVGHVQWNLFLFPAIGVQDESFRVTVAVSPNSKKAWVGSRSAQRSRRKNCLPVPWQSNTSFRLALDSAVLPPMRDEKNHGRNHEGRFE